MGRLILHIGTHKTGTTSIQRFAASNRALLAERGCLYPNYDLIGLKGHYAHLAIARAISGSHDDNVFDMDVVRMFFRAVAERLTEYDIALVSAEPFYRIVSKGEKINRHNYWPRREEVIGLTRDIIGPIDAEVVIILRDQADFAVSMYQEHVKVTRYCRNFAEFRREFWYLFDYRKQIEAWRKFFGSVKVGGYADLSSGGELEKSFFEFIGVRARDLSKGKSHNISVHPDIVLLKAALNQAGLPDADLASFIACFRDWRGPTEGGLGPRSLWSSHLERHLFQLRFLGDNSEIERAGQRAEGSMFPISDLPGNTVYGEELHAASISCLVSTLEQKRSENALKLSPLVLSTLAVTFTQAGHGGAAERLRRLSMDG